MPVVPSLDPSQQVTPSQAPDVQSSSVVSAGLLSQSAQQLSETGAALGQASDATSQIAVDAQNRVNQTRVDDANNQVQAAAYSLKYDPANGYANKTGAAAITPDENGQMPADAAVAKLNDTAQSVRSQLSPEQQRQFDISYGSFSTNFAGEALAHEGQQTRQYSLDTNNSTIQLAQGAAAQDYANPALLDNHVASAGNAAFKNAQVQGLQGPALTQTVKQAETTAIMAGYNAAVAKGDFNSASAIQSKYGSFLTADAAVEVDKQQTVITNNQLATAAAARATLGPQIALTPSGQAFAANVSVESGGKQTNPDGTPVTSTKGAVGIAQVLPATAQETAEKHGIPWDPAKFSTDPTYNRLLGQTYWQDQLAANNGDIAKADAAYNGGPGALQAAVTKAAAAGTPNAWLSFMPPETQAYVPKVAAIRQTGAVSPAVMPTKLDVINSVSTDPTLQNNPIAMKAAVELAVQRWEAGQESVRQTRAQALASAQTTIAANGGDLSKVPPATIAAIDPKDIPDLQTYAGKIREGGTTTNQALYADVMNNPQKYAAMSDQQWQTAAQPNLSQSDFQTLTKQRAEFKAGTSSQSAGSIDTAAVKEIVDNAAVQMGLNPRTPLNPSGDMSASEHVGALYKGANDYVLARQQQVGKKLSPADTQAAVSQFLTTNVPANTGGWFGGSAQPMQLQTMTADNIPSAIKTSLTAKLKSAGVPNPSDGQMLDAYLHLPSSVRGDIQ